MSPAPQPWRLGLFCAACAVLVVAAIGFAGGGHSPAPPPSSPAQPQVVSATPPAAQPAVGGVAGLRSELGGAAHRFLAAFFRYEVGDLGPAVRQALRANATPGFAAELLAAPPWRPARSVPAAVSGPLAIAVASVSPPRAVVSGFGLRGSEREDFSFVFEAVDGVWLASEPGE